MISPDLLKILCCPETKAPLDLANGIELTEINRRIEKKELFTKEGKVVSEPLSGALVRADRKILYRIQNDIPILLIQEGILL